MQSLYLCCGIGLVLSIISSVFFCTFADCETRTKVFTSMMMTILGINLGLVIAFPISMFVNPKYDISSNGVEEINAQIDNVISISGVSYNLSDPFIVNSVSKKIKHGYAWVNHYRVTNKYSMKPDYVEVVIGYGKDNGEKY